jgi:hypothetical protein
MQQLSLYDTYQPQLKVSKIRRNLYPQITTPYTPLEKDPILLSVPTFEASKIITN